MAWHTFYAGIVDCRHTIERSKDPDNSRLSLANVREALLCIADSDSGKDDRKEHLRRSTHQYRMSVLA